jgi:hypothetical protein
MAMNTGEADEGTVESVVPRPPSRGAREARRSSSGAGLTLAAMVSVLF